MIIGHGDIAGVLKDKKNWIFFASGVSNSAEKRKSEFQREIDLLLRQNKNLHLVYFGSLSIFYSNTPYSRHKKRMEDLIKKNFKHYTIVRLGNITWGNNPHTFINYFRNVLKNGGQITIWDTYRYLIDQEELNHWLDLLPDWNCEINITGKRMKVKEIVEKYVLT